MSLINNDVLEVALQNLQLLSRIGRLEGINLNLFSANLCVHLQSLVVTKAVEGKAGKAFTPHVLTNVPPKSYSLFHNIILGLKR